MNLSSVEIKTLLSEKCTLPHKICNKRGSVVEKNVMVINAKCLLELCNKPFSKETEMIKTLFK